jgi:ketosteroid isomerase-like protein
MGEPGFPRVALVRVVGIGFDGAITVEPRDLDILADRNLAYNHGIQHVTSDDKQCKNLTVRVTDMYKKDAGRWLIIHEHVSEPVSLETISAPNHSPEALR